MKLNLRKKILALTAILLITSLTLASFSTAEGSTNSIEVFRNTIVMYSNCTNAYVNGSLTKIDSNNSKVTPVIKGKITYIPLLFICDSLGGKFGWDEATSYATVCLNNKEIIFKDKSDIAKVGDKKIELEGKVTRINGAVCVPAKSLASLIGKKLFLDKGLIILSDKANLLDKKKDAYLIKSIIAKIKTGTQKQLFEATTNKKITLEKYVQSGVFTMQKPKGWSVYNAGEYNTLAFLARDEKEPLRQIFCFSEIGPFYTSEQQKEIEQNYVANGGYSMQWIDMPVVSPLNGTSFMQKFNSIFEANIGQGFLSLYGMPKPVGFEKISVCSEHKLPDYFSGMGTGLVRALLFSDGKAAEGLFVVSGVPDANGHAYAYMVTGIVMPKDEFKDALPVLRKAVESFTLDKKYLKKGMQEIEENGEILEQISNTLNKTSDSMIDYWNNRSKAEDIWSEKESDSNLGYERVYDENTGEVYQVENGFYDYYQTHEDQYQNRELQPLPEDDYDLWTAVPITDNSLSIP